MAGLLLVNRRAGAARPTPEELADEAERRGIVVHLVDPTRDDPTELAQGADADALGVAGGDGSLAAVAAVAVERNLPFVCVPFGTRNHFARDLGLDRDDPFGALAAFGGAERLIDVGRVNGRLFLNNVSLGAYARLVHRRERHRRRGEAVAALRALGLAVRRRHRLNALVGGRSIRARVVLVANNHYRLDLFSLGERDRLDDGLLHLYAARGILPHTWTEDTAPRFTIDVGARRVEAAVDGEPVELDAPLELEIEPRALRVLVPKPRR